MKNKKVNFHIFIGDLKNKNFIRRLENKIVKIDNLINNAAVANTKFFTKVSDNELNNIIDVNIKASFQLSQVFAKKMIKHKIKGNIINISSQLGHIGAYNRSAYCMTKFAIEGLSKSIALDLAKYGIRVNTVAPTKTLHKNEVLKKTTKRLRLIKNKIPLKKFSTLNEVAGIVFFLTSNSAKSITGSSIVTDGGWTAGK